MGNDTSTPFGSNTIVSASSDNTLKVWDMAMYVSYRTLDGHKGSVKGVARLDHTRALSCSSDNSVHLWDINDGGFVSFKGHSRSIESIIALNNNTFATGDCEGVLRFYDTRNNSTYVQVFQAHRGPIRKLALYNNFVLTGGGDGFVSLVAMNKPQPITTLNIGTPVLSLTCLGSNMLAVGTEGGIHMHHINSGDRIKNIAYNPSYTLIGAEDASSFIVGYEDGMSGGISVINFKKGYATKQFQETHNGKVTGFSYLGTKNYFVSACSGGCLKVWDINKVSSSVHHLDAHERSINAICCL